MRKMKILTLLLCASLAFAYMGCSNSSGGSGADTGSGAGSGSTPITYTITIANEITNGTVTANPASAIAGSTVTLSIISESGYKLNSISATTGETTVTLSGTGNTRTFTMPAGNVSVNAGFISVFTALAAGTNGTAGTSWTYVEFGKWPQSEKTNDTISVDETDSNSVGSFTYYKGGDGEWYAKIEKNSQVSYYKVEPIKWRVLTADYNGTGKKLLLAEKILINKAYHASSNNYENSSIRAYLTGDFFTTAFTQAEQDAIATTTVINNARSTNPDSNDKQWNEGNNRYASDTATSDKIFLLSEQEVTKADYGFAAYDQYGYSQYGIGNTRIRMTTAFAKAKGAYQDTSGGFGGCWWLRSPYYNYSNYARDVRNDGVAELGGDVNRATCGIVPALCLN